MYDDASTILLVEDDDATRTFLADNLTADGYDLLVADTARDVRGVGGILYFCLSGHWPHAEAGTRALPDGPIHQPQASTACTLESTASTPPPTTS